MSSLKPWLPRSKAKLSLAKQLTTIRSRLYLTEKRMTMKSVKTASVSTGLSEINSNSSPSNLALSLMIKELLNFQVLTPRVYLISNTTSPITSNFTLEGRSQKAKSRTIRTSIVAIGCLDSARLIKTKHLNSLKLPLKKQQAKFKQSLLPKRTFQWQK